MGSLTATSAKAVAGAATGNTKSSPAKETKKDHWADSKSTPAKSTAGSGVKSASSSVRAGSDKKEKAPAETKFSYSPKNSAGSGSKTSSTASRAESTASKVSDSGSYSTSSKKSAPKASGTVAKAGSGGASAGKTSASGNSLLMGNAANRDDHSAVNNFTAGLRALGLGGGAPAPAGAPTSDLLDPGNTRLPDGTWSADGDLGIVWREGMMGRGLPAAVPGPDMSLTPTEGAARAEQALSRDQRDAITRSIQQSRVDALGGVPLVGSIVNGGASLADLMRSQGTAAPTPPAATTGTQQPSAEQIRALETASQQIGLDQLNSIPFAGSIANYAGSMGDLLRSATTPREPVKITIPGPGTAGINAASWTNATDRVFAPRLPSDAETKGKVAPPITLLGTPADSSVAQEYLDGQTSAPLLSPGYIARTVASMGDYVPKVTDSSNPGDLFQTNGQSSTPSGTVTRPGEQTSSTYGYPPAGGGVDAAAEPRVWDGVVDNTGKLLSHTALGSIVSTLFPDLWSGMGDAFKGIGTGEPNSLLDPTGNPSAGYWNRSEGTWTGADGQVDQPRTGTFSDGNGTYTRPPPFPDLNHNGRDDRKEGYTGPDTRPPRNRHSTTPPPGTTPPPTTGGDIPPMVFDLPPERLAQFPPQPPYDPGRSPEFTYFLNNHLADGGMVEAPRYAEGGEIDMADPKVQLIGATEDVLEKVKGGASADKQEVDILEEFVAQFGVAALKALYDNVAEGLSMKSAGSAGSAASSGGIDGAQRRPTKMKGKKLDKPGIPGQLEMGLDGREYIYIPEWNTDPMFPETGWVPVKSPGGGEAYLTSESGNGRLIKGKGGPKEDKVPAVIVDEGTEVSPARLSPDEFVMPQAAVAGAGGGDVKLGAERLQQLAERLSVGKGAAKSEEPKTFATPEFNKAYGELTRAIKKTNDSTLGSRPFGAPEYPRTGGGF